MTLAFRQATAAEQNIVQTTITDGFPDLDAKTYVEQHQSAYPLLTFSWMKAWVASWPA